MKKIIVTGATSMIGVATIEAAISQNHELEVYALVRNNTSRMDRLPVSTQIHIVYGSLENLLDISDLPSKCDVLYHFAWAGTSKAERDDPLIQESNIRYTLDAVELARRCGCKKFIGAGSQAEYGPTEGTITDDTRFSPVTSYGASKLSAGLLSRKLCDKYGIIHIWGRIFSVYGPHDNEGTMLNYAINQFASGEKAKFSAATQTWNYLFESDAGMMFYLLGEKINNSDCYRIAHAESKPLKDYIRIISRIMDAEVLCRFAEESGDKKIYGIDSSDERLYRDIGYTPSVDFEEGIQMMIKKRTRTV